MSVDNERKEGYGEIGCDKAMSVDGGVLCVMNEGMEGLKEMLARDGVCWVTWETVLLKLVTSRWLLVR